jgi:hypothetical protein
MISLESRQVKSKKLTRALLIIFLFTSLAGAVRKWVLTSAGIANGIFFVQILLPFIFLIYYNNKTKIKSQILFLYFIILLVMMFNPMNHTLYHGILGVLLHFGFWFMLSFYLFNMQRFDTEKLINIVFYFSVFQIILGIIQYTLPPNHFLNKYVETDNKNIVTALVGNKVRVTGTFSYLSGFTSFLYLYPFVGFLYYLYNLGKKNAKIFYLFIYLILGFVGCLVSGARGVLVTYVLTIFCFLAYMTKKLKAKSVVGMIFAFFVLLFVYNSFISKGDNAVSKFLDVAFGNYEERVSSNAKSGEQSKRIFGPLEEVINYRGKYPYFGVGLGATYQGAIALFGESQYVKDYEGGYEEELERIILEGGFLLLLFKVILVIMVVKKMTMPYYFKFLFALSILYLTPMVFNIYNSIFIGLSIFFINSYFYNIKETLLAERFAALKAIENS